MQSNRTPSETAGGSPKLFAMWGSAEVELCTFHSFYVLVATADIKHAKVAQLVNFDIRGQRLICVIVSIKPGTKPEESWLELDLADKGGRS